MWDVVPTKKVAFQEALLDWYRMGRRRFSWRNGRRNAYQTLIAEVMLRKTDAIKVAAIYDEFIVRYPSPAELAAADEVELRQTIQLIGITDRARLLRLTAQKLLDEHAGRVPADQEALMKLPGVGRYIANAVLCFAYHRDAALVDTNIIRIIERVFSVRSRKPRPREDRALWKWAGTLVPVGRAVRYNRALLDFAASICTAAKPKCEDCPLQFICDYGQARPAARLRGGALVQVRAIPDPRR